MATQPWQNRLTSYAGNSSAGNTEIDRAKQVYETKKAAGDMAGANAAHNWANQIRDAMGTSSNYDRTTGASIQQAQPDMMQQAQTQAAAIYDPMRDAQLAQIRAAKSKALGQLDLTRQQVTPQYTGLKNQTDAANVQAVQKLRELMAAQGMANSGDNVSGQVALSAQRGSDINNLNLQQQQRLNEIDQSVSDVNNSNDEAAVIAQLNAEQAKAVADLKARMEDVAYRQQQFDEGVRQYNQNFGQSTLESNRNYGLANSESKMNLRQVLAGITGYDPATGKPTLNSKQVDAQIANANAGTAQGWAGLALDSAKLGASNQQDSGKAITSATTYANGAIDKLKVGQPFTDSLGDKVTKQVDLSPADKASLKQNFRTALNAIISAGGDPSTTLAQRKQDLYDNYGQYQGNILYNLLQGAVGSLGE